MVHAAFITMPLPQYNWTQCRQPLCYKPIHSYEQERERVMHNGGDRGLGFALFFSFEPQCVCTMYVQPLHMHTHTQTHISLAYHTTIQYNNRTHMPWGQALALYRTQSHTLCVSVCVCVNAAHAYKANTIKYTNNNDIQRLGVHKHTHRQQASRPAGRQAGKQTASAEHIGLGKADKRHVYGAHTHKHKHTNTCIQLDVAYIQTHSVQPPQSVFTIMFHSLYTIVENLCSVSRVAAAAPKLFHCVCWVWILLIQLNNTFSFVSFPLFSRNFVTNFSVEQLSSHRQVVDYYFLFVFCR